VSDDDGLEQSSTGKDSNHHPDQNRHDDDEPNVGKLCGYTATPFGRKEQREGTNDV
jgi:hypothetical protein